MTLTKINKIFNNHKIGVFHLMRFNLLIIYENLGKLTISFIR